jgi:hypothetical protein
MPSLGSSMTRVELFIQDRSRETRPILGEINKDLADTHS